jgi:hypothetical protein
MINEHRVDKVEHVWSEKEDRWIYIEYNAQRKIIGLNFMQGDEYEYFKKSWCYNDQGLTDFYYSMLYTFPIEKASVNTIEFMDKCMWAFHSAIVAREDYPYGGNDTNKLQT